MKNYFLIVLFLLIINKSQSQTNDVKPIWQFGMYGNNVGESVMSVKDINNDSYNELLISSSISTSSWEREDYFYILEYSELTDSYQFSWISRIFNAKINTISFKNLNNDQFQDIIIGLNNGKIHFFDGKNRKEIKEFNTNRESINSLYILDVDNDNQDEFIICDNNVITIYNLSLSMNMEIPYGGSEMQVGNIDNDDALEIVLSSGKVIEVQNDNYSIEKEFQSSDNYDLFNLYDFDNDDKLELVYQTNYTELTGYDFSSDNATWTLNTSSSLESLFIYKNQTTNKNEIYIGTTYDGINIYDASNGSFIQKMPDHHEGVNNLTIGDVDNDSQVELIWADGAYCSGEDYIYINNLDDLSEEWKNFPLNGPFTALDFGDVDNDGDLEFVITSESSGSHEGGVINVFNATDYTLEWRSEPFNYDISSVKIADIDKDNVNELLVGIEFTGYVVPATFLYIYNTNDYTIEDAVELRDSRRTRDIEVADINNDSSNEIILSTGSGWSSDKSHVFILSGTTKELLWKSEEFGGTLNYTYSLNISNIDNDDALEIVGIDYGFWGDNKGDIFIIDGIDYSISYDTQFSYSCLSIGDYDKDSDLDIIAGTDDGEIVILDGTNLEPLYYLNNGSEKISAIKLIDSSSDYNTNNLLISNSIQLELANSGETEPLWVSDSIHSNLGAFNNMVCSNMNDDENFEVLIGSNHSCFLYSISDEQININEYPWDNETTDIYDDEFIKESSLYIYPNPFKNEIMLCFNSQLQSNAKIELFDIYGRLVYTEIVNSSLGNNKSVSLSNLSSGTYIFRISQGSKIISSQKIIKL